MDHVSSSLQTSCDVSYPPLDGSLYFPEMIEYNATHNPAHTFYTFYNGATDTLRHVSHLEFYRACQRIAHAIRPNRQGSDRAVVGILVNCDTILYHALTMGVIYAGLIPFPMSPRNSPAAVANMMRKTGCRRLMATHHSLAALLDGIKGEFARCEDGQPATELELEEMPTLSYAYPNLGEETVSTPFVPYPKADQRPVENATMYYLHSSGSTGFPKPIPITFLSAVHWCIAPAALQHMEFPTYLRLCAASPPPFHSYGMFFQLFCPTVSLKSVSLYAPTSYHDRTTPPVVPSAHGTIEVIQRTNATALLAVPAFLEEWATSPHVVELLADLEYVVYAGGPLSKKTGDALVVAGVNVTPSYGLTEARSMTLVFRDPAERIHWEWVRFGDNECIRWVPQGDGSYECQILTTPTHQLSIENIPDVKGYATADAFIKHPTIEGLYKIVGRLDDVLVHSFGEKTVPAPMETVISSNRFLSGVCMFGRGRNQTGVLVEPKPECAIDVVDEEQVAEFRNKVWPEIEEANRGAPAFSRIFKEMILVTSKDKPMLRAAKGTVMKKATMKLYEPEIDALYESVEASSRAGTDIAMPTTWSQVEVENWLLAHATAVSAVKPVRVDVDLFEQGFDSLSSTFLKNRILGSVRASPHKEIREAASRIGQNIIFANPTLQRLAAHLIQCVASEGTSSAGSDPEAEIQDMIVKYAIGLEGRVGGLPGKFHNHHVVLLTGTTGGLGSYLLASLLGRSDVGIVYAFNRPSKTDTIHRRQHAAFEDRGLDTTLLDSSKLIYLEGDAAQPSLSLDDQTYTEIRDSVTVIIHNAWRLDFNLSLSSFEPNVRGTRHLIDLARGSKWSAKPRFLFTSSVSSAQGWDKSKGAFPEEVQLDAGVAVGPGYGASKYVSERVLAVSGLPATSFRIGQITGGVPRGSWSTSDWVPIIVKSSVTLGAFPDARGVTSWLPPHAVSDAMLEVAFANEEPPFAVNLTHPRPVAWTSLMQPISEAVSQRQLTPSPLPLVPFDEWVKRLSACAMDTREASIKLPAIKLFDFMRSLRDGDEALRRKESGVTTGPLEVTQEAIGLASFMTNVAQRVSKTMRTLQPLSAEDATRWVDYWMSVGMFSEGSETLAPI